MSYISSCPCKLNSPLTIQNLIRKKKLLKINIINKIFLKNIYFILKLVKTFSYKYVHTPLQPLGGCPTLQTTITPIQFSSHRRLQQSSWTWRRLLVQSSWPPPRWAQCSPPMTFMHLRPPQPTMLPLACRLPGLWLGHQSYLFSPFIYSRRNIYVWRWWRKRDLCIRGIRFMNDCIF